MTNQMGCSVDMRYKAYCNLDRLSQVKSPAFQYFSNPNLYGLSPYTDYCPYYRYGGACRGRWAMAGGCCGDGWAGL